MGITGAPTVDTPHIDNYALRGRRLTTWYSGYPVCSASRTALLTGRQPPRVGMPGVINSLGVEGLPLSERTVADRLQALGYKTLVLGKWCVADAETAPHSKRPAALQEFSRNSELSFGYVLEPGLLRTISKRRASNSPHEMPAAHFE